MNHVISKHRTRCKLAAVMALLIPVLSCTSYGNRSTTSDTLPDSIVSILEDCQRLKKDIDKRERVILKLTADMDRLNESLAYVEQHFVVADSRRTHPESRASAVAALTRAKHFYSSVINDEPSAAQLRSVHEAQVRLETSDRLLSENRFVASVYFSNRAMDLVRERHEATNVRIIRVDRANVRRGPGKHFDVLAQLDQGTVLFEVGGQSSWYRVQTLDGVAGWVHSSVTTTR